MELLMYLLLLIKDGEAAAAYLGTLPLLILILLTGTVLAIRRNGSLEIWIAANAILSISSAAASLNRESSGIPLNILVLAAFAAGLIFFVLSRRFSKLMNRKYAWIVPALISAGTLAAMVFLGSDPQNSGTITGIAVLGHSIMFTELVKIFAALFYASLFSRSEDQFTDPVKVIISTLYFAACAGLLTVMRELGTILVLLILHIACMYLFMEDTKLKTVYLLLIAAGIGIGILFLIWVYPRLNIEIGLLNKLYDRIIGCFALEQLDLYNEGFSAMQSARSIILGGLFGTSELSVLLPQASNDFIYAYVLNNLGSVFGLLIFGMYVLIAICGLKNALQMNGSQKILYCSFVILFTMQSLYSIAMNCNFLPVCGITCCLLSRGGMSMLVSMIMIVYMVLSKPEKEVLQ